MSGLPYLVEGHQLLAIHLLGLVQRDELDVLGGLSFVGEGALDGVQIMGTDRDQSPLARQVLVQFILKGNERLIASLVELDTAENGTGHVRSDLGGLEAH
jgi:hypothetical protein